MHSGPRQYNNIGMGGGHAPAPGHISDTISLLTGRHKPEGDPGPVHNSSWLPLGASAKGKVTPVTRDVTFTLAVEPWAGAGTVTVRLPTTVTVPGRDTFKTRQLVLPTRSTAVTFSTW